MNQKIKHASTRILVLFTIIVVCSILSFSVNANDMEDMIAHSFYVTDESQAYLFTYDGNKTSLQRFSYVPNAKAYEILDINNGSILFRVLHTGDWWADHFHDTRIMDVSSMTYGIPIALDDYMGTLKMLDNGKVITRTPMGAYRIFDPDTLQETKLQFDYGPKIEVADFDWDEYDKYFNTRFDFRTYIGLNLTYSAKDNMYAMLYCLSPYYSGIINNKLDDTSTTHKPHIALFDKEGKLIKHFPLPKEYHVDCYSALAVDELIYDKYKIAWRSNFQYVDSELLYFSYGENIKLYASLCDKDNKYVEVEIYVDNETAIPMKTTITADLSSPITIDNKDYSTIILSADKKALLYSMGKDYKIVFETKDQKGKYYAILAREFEVPPYEEDIVG